jgi:hypothetical protein
LGRPADGGDVAADELLPTLTPLGHERSVLEHRDVLLHGGEAHRVLAGETRNGVLVLQGAHHDVSPGRVGQRAEDPVDLFVGQLIYNH